MNVPCHTDWSISLLRRSIHTNYAAQFSCDVIKLAVLKNPWLAAKFNGKTFDVMFRFEKFDASEDGLAK